MRFFYTLILLIVLLIVSFEMQAQPQRFKAGVIVGLNASQIDGDRFYGYNKLGLVAGLNGVTILNDKMEMSIELLYSQRGSRSSLVPGNSIFPFKISTDFIEVPVLFNYKDWHNPEGEYYRFHFHAGFSYGRLIRTEVDDGTPNSNFVQAGESFNKNDWSYIFGATFFTGPHLAFTFRWSRSFGVLYLNTANNPGVPSLQNHMLSFRTLYMF